MYFYTSLGNLMDMRQLICLVVSIYVFICSISLSSNGWLKYQLLPCISIGDFLNLENHRTTQRGWTATKSDPGKTNSHRPWPWQGRNPMWLIVSAWQFCFSGNNLANLSCVKSFGTINLDLDACYVWVGLRPPAKMATWQHAWPNINAQGSCSGLPARNIRRRPRIKNPQLRFVWALLGIILDLLASIIQKALNEWFWTWLHQW